MALTKPRIGQLDTSVFTGSDPLTVLHAGATVANVDVGFLMNRANGLVSNVALYWSESGNAFVTSFTSNTGITDSNIAITGYAPLVSGTHTVQGDLTVTGMASFIQTETVLGIEVVARQQQLWWEREWLTVPQSELV